MNALILISLLIVLMALRVPVVFSLLLSCMAYVLFIKPIPMIIFAHRMLGSLESFPLLSLPLYILAADIMNSGWITEEMFRLARSLVGHIKGSMGLGPDDPCNYIRWYHQRSVHAHGSRCGGGDLFIYHLIFRLQNPVT